MKIDSRLTQRLLPFLSLIVLFVALAIASPYFLTANNMASVARQTAVFNTMALGMTIVIVSGGIDVPSQKGGKAYNSNIAFGTGDL